MTPGGASARRRAAEGHGLVDVARSFAVAARLGWQMEANWTDPLLFFIYSVAKPVASALILVVMLEVVGGASSREYRGFVVVGSALWSFVTSGIGGLAVAVIEDRERFRTLKYIYISPSKFLVVLVGRGVARIGIGVAGALVTLLVGVTMLAVPIDPARVDWPILLVDSVLGLGAIVALGVLMAAVCIQTRQESWNYPEAFARAIFLLCGAVFPLAVLPVAAQVAGLLLPTTWWIAGVRAALLPGGRDSVGGAGTAFAALLGHPVPTTGEVVLALLLTGALATLASLAVFRASDRRAREAGLLDRTTGS